MSKRSRIVGFVLALAVLSSTLAVSSAASMPIMKSDSAHRQGTVAANRPHAKTAAYREYWCRIVTATDIRVFESSTSSTVIGRLLKGDVFATTGIANNRYHVYNPFSDTWKGWVTADPQWTDYYGHYCFG
ncbi:MAG TPA: hypothetical protein VFZ66_21765 [Herpetosiphonaceae bacterium]